MSITYLTMREKSHLTPVNYTIARYLEKSVTSYKFYLRRRRVKRGEHGKTQLIKVSRELSVT